MTSGAVSHVFGRPVGKPGPALVPQTRAHRHPLSWQQLPQQRREKSRALREKSVDVVCSNSIQQAARFPVGRILSMSADASSGRSMLGMVWQSRPGARAAS
jgi:hypothetical protein